MITIVKRPLPHGVVPYTLVANPQVRDCLMKIAENQKALDKKISDLQSAIIELQRRN